MSADVDLDGVAVVVPMHNEAAVVAGVVGDLRTRFSRVVCVDDGSHDGSADLARAAGATVVRHPVNLGQGAALETGIRFALRDPQTAFVVTFDADGQHRVADAAAMVGRAVQEDLQVVLGSRFLEPSSDLPRVRRLLLRAAARFTRATTGLAVTDAHNGLRVLRRDAAERVRLRLHGMSHASEILGAVAQGGLRYAEHPVTIDYTEYSIAKGQRSYNALNIVFELAVNRVRAVA